MKLIRLRQVPMITAPNMSTCRVPMLSIRILNFSLESSRVGTKDCSLLPAKAVGMGMGMGMVLVWVWVWYGCGWVWVWLGVARNTLLYCLGILTTKSPTSKVGKQGQFT